MIALSWSRTIRRAIHTPMMLRFRCRLATLAIVNRAAWAFERTDPGRSPWEVARRSAACHVTLVEHVASDAALSIAPTIALTITEADDPGGALFANGDRQAYEAPRDVARHAIVRDRPPVERHAPRLRRPRWGVDRLISRRSDFTRRTLGTFAPSATNTDDGGRGLPRSLLSHVLAFPAAEECPVARYWRRRILFKGRGDVQQVSRAMIPVSRAAAAPRFRLYSAFNRSRRCTRYSLFDPLTDSSSKHDVQRDGTWEKQRKHRLFGDSQLLKNMSGNILEFKRADVSLNVSSACEVIIPGGSWCDGIFEPFVRCLFKG